MLPLRSYSRTTSCCAGFDGARPAATRVKGQSQIVAKPRHHYVQRSVSQSTRCNSMVGTSIARWGSLVPADYHDNEAFINCILHYFLCPFSTPPLETKQLLSGRMRVFTPFRRFMFFCCYKFVVLNATNYLASLSNSIIISFLLWTTE